MSRGKQPRAALSSRSYSRAKAWRVDCDYVGQLSETEKDWMAAFLDRYYGADFRGASPAEWTDDARKERYRANNAANRDLMTCAVPAEEQPDDPVLELEDAYDLPDDTTYTTTPDYKAALAAYRDDPSPANRVRLSRTQRSR